MTDWQPIETAPRDGSRFLVFATAQMGWENIYGIASWFKMFPLDPEESRFLYHFWAENISCSNCSVVDDDPEPTHWMPLPVPPKS